MCGIIGYIGAEDNASTIIADGLRRLEYRGYDSVGMALIADQKIVYSKKTGRDLKALDILSKIGIGHTRWFSLPYIIISINHKNPISFGPYFRVSIFENCLFFVLFFT